MKNLLVIALLIITSAQAAKSSFSKELILGNILKGTLEGMHLSSKEINDDLSEKAFKLYLERIDYGKQFLTQSDVKTLAQFQDEFDNQLASGKLKIVEETDKIVKARIKEVEGYVNSTLEKKFDFKKKETLESDPEKREFAKSSAELKDLWYRILKYEVLGRFADLKETQEDEKKDAKKKKKKFKEKSLAKLESEAYKKVKKNYKRIFKRLKNEKARDYRERFYNSITRVFDPHTNYMAPDDKEDFDIDMSGKLEGIGAVLREEDSYIVVERIVPGSASYRQKELKAGDKILKVGQAKKDPVDIVNMPLRDAVKLIRGKKGTEVRLTVKHASGDIKVIPIVRDEVIIKDSYVKANIITHEKIGKKIGYIKVPKFYRDFNDPSGRNCTDDVKKELLRFKENGVEGVILDLRNNGGGALDDARMMSGLFIGKGPIVQVKASSGSVEVLKSNNPNVVFSKPVIVIVNKLSASASEIVAAALQDYGRAVVVGGEYSHGKGTVQAVIDLDAYLSPMARSYSPLGALKITIQKFYRINGSSTQFKGVTPDIVLPDPYAYLETGEKYLDYALPWAKVNAVPYKAWDEYTYNIPKLKKSSDKRVAKNERFQKIIQSNNWYKKRKKDTVKMLTLADYNGERTKVKEEIKKFKVEGEIEAIQVASLDELKTKEDKDVFEEEKKDLRSDPMLEESLFIMKDMIGEVVASK
jgi:carboxyl-terminal processing protease